MLALMMAMFVSMLAATVVSTSLPVIIADLGGDQSAFTWVVTATLLATTVSTPVWGKLADLFNRKLLLQLALTLFVVATAIAGFSTTTDMLILMRVFQGLGAGGLAALSQIVMADVVSPRERGRYAGLFGAAMALGTVGGPLLGGFLTDTLSWHWNFYVAIPFAVAALVMLQRSLHLPKQTRSSTRIDYLGIVLISSGISLVLLWVSFGGAQFAWSSLPSYAMIGGAVAILVVAVWWELRAADPLLPLTMFRNRTFTLAVIASLATGVAMFGTSVFLSQYMQLARGATPMESGVMTIPMMAGLLITSTIIGNVVSRTGIWKRFVVTGSILMVVGLALLSTLHYDTAFWIVGVSMATLGAGVGMVMQNLVIVTQNAVETRHLGVATSAVTFFRSLGGTIGVSAMGSILGSVVASQITTSIGSLSPTDQAAAAQALGDGTIPKLAELPDAIRVVVEAAYGIGIGRVFLAALPLAVITVVAAFLLPNVPLGTQNAVEKRAAEAGEVVDEGGLHRVSAAEVLEEAEDLTIESASAVAALPAVGSGRRGDNVRDGSGE
ncbi:MFS transporter [Serinibacter arcticus]|uniref:MFS transporter n=2 Tax=Serinibacter arcticus TaxID=1655435 RepID=A0A2U1ZZX6_9MICO|nr:MFS transporter [Serinibacter arcticus]